MTVGMVGEKFTFSRVTGPVSNKFGYNITHTNWAGPLRLHTGLVSFPAPGDFFQGEIHRCPGGLVSFPA